MKNMFESRFWPELKLEYKTDLEAVYMLTIKNISKNYNGSPVINGISLSITNNEALAIVGPNGSGKSTLLNLILGTLSPSSGTINCDRKRIGAAVSRDGFIADMSEANNSELFIALSRGSEERFHFLLEELKMDFLTNGIRDLSSRMKQKLNLFVALLNLNDIVLLDEPFAHLDQPAIEFVIDLIKKEKQFGKSFIITSQTLNQLAISCDRIIFLNRGKIITEAPTQTLIKEFNSVEAAYKHFIL